MKTAEVQLPDSIYQRIETLAVQLQITVPELLRRAAEQMVQRHPQSQPKTNGDWHFPEGRHLGAFLTSTEDWRLLANEPAD